MSQLTNIPLQDNYRSTLSQSWDGNTGTIYVNTAPSFTFPSGVKTYICVDPGKTNMQVARISAYNSTLKTITVDSITTDKGNGVAYTAQTHTVGSIIEISDNYQFRKDIQTAVNTKVNTNSTDTDTGKFANAAARDAYFTSPVNGNSAYLIAEGYWTDYSGGSRQQRANGATPNMSTSVTGKGRLADQTQVNNGDATEAGDPLVVGPAELKVVTDGFAATNSQAETGTATGVFINPVQLKTSFGGTPIAGTTITMCSSTTVTTTNSATYIKKYQATIQRSGTYTITFGIKTGGSGLYYGRIYKNGVAFGTERTSNTTSYDTFNENLTFAAGDTVELWLKYASGIHTTDCNGISVTYSVGPATTVTTY